MESCHLRHDFLAGPDAIRLRDLHTAFASPEVRGIFVARGGYGAARLLPYMDFRLIARNPKVFVGYSDVTALHIAITQRCGFVTFHGPMPAVDFVGDAATLEILCNMIFERHGQQPTASKCGTTNIWHGLDIDLSGVISIVPGHARGRLTGGNLTLLAASLGTPFEIDTRGCILFIEETGEPPYRVDRLINQLKQASKLSQAAGIVLGDFSPETPETLAITIQELIVPEGKPTLAGFPSGHTSPNVTLPMGATVDF